jgi:methanogenic corrinoid protein MtbC1
MLEMTGSGEAVEEYLDHAVAGHGRAGARLAFDLLDHGASFDEVIVDLLAAAQREVGDRWLHNDYSVADEHLATAVTQSTLNVVTSSVEPPAPGGLVIVTCAEGDWHSLPSQMFAEMLRSRGFAIAFLGASTPVEHVAALIARHRPNAVAVSCNVPLFFSGMARTVDAAHHEGTPVIAGGRALGGKPDRAVRLGADAWAGGVDDAVAVLGGWQRDPPTVTTEPTRLDPAAMQLELNAPQIAAAAFRALIAAYPPMADYHVQQLARTQEDLAFIVRFAAAARLVDDAAILDDMLDWLRTLLASRSVHASAVTAGLEVLAPLIDPIDAHAGQLVRNGF